MMNKAQSARVHLIRFLFLLPLLVVVLLAFRNTTQIHRQSLRTLVTDTIPDAEKMPPGWKDMESIDVDNSKVIVTLKNKKVEKYDLSNNKDREVFQQKYGALPTPPPPPPAPIIKRDIEVTEVPEPPEPPEPPKKPAAAEAPRHLILMVDPATPEAPEAPKKLKLSVAPKDPQVLALTPVPPPPPPVPAQDCYNEKGFCITVVDNRGEAIVIVKDKDNKIVLAVSLTDWKKDKQYEDKYGEVPTHQISLLPKTVIGYKKVPVIIKAADARNDENIIADNPYHVAYKRNYMPMYALTPDSNVVAVRIVTGRPSSFVKVAAQPKTVVVAKVITAASVKTAAKVQVAAEPKPAVPTKEQ
jgi:hypothetical protein